jgi:DNA-binding NarL/FixJ family response regulator
MTLQSTSFDFFFESMTTLRITLFEDNKALNRALCHLIESTSDLVVAGSYFNCVDVLRDIAQSNPDVVLMDIDMPEVNGIEGVRAIRRQFPKLRILMQTVFDDDEKIFEAIAAGASGYLLKNTTPENMLNAIREVHAGGAPMSPSIATRVLYMFQNNLMKTSEESQLEEFNLSKREMDVLRCMVSGKPYKIICDELNISYSTVRTHVQNIYDKLHVSSNTEAVSKALKSRLF